MWGAYAPLQTYNVDASGDVEDLLKHMLETVSGDERNLAIFKSILIWSDSSLGDLKQLETSSENVVRPVSDEPVHKAP